MVSISVMVVHVVLASGVSFAVGLGVGVWIGIRLVACMLATRAKARGMVGALEALLKPDRPASAAVQCCGAMPPAGWYCTRPAGHDGPCAVQECETGNRRGDWTGVRQSVTRVGHIPGR